MTAPLGTKVAQLRADVDAIAEAHAHLLKMVATYREREELRYEQALATIEGLRARIDVQRDAMVQLIDALHRAGGVAERGKE